jgi:bacterioferritin-associated ferredoxin
LNIIINTREERSAMIVCLCRNISEQCVRAAIAAGARSPSDLAQACAAGTDCGACKPTLHCMLGEPGSGAEAEPTESTRQRPKVIAR